MAILNLLSIARSALLTQQQALDTVGHNIANAGNEQYTRQRAVVQAATPQQTSYGAVGRGVTIRTMQRLRDEFLDFRFRDEQSLGGRYEALNERLSQIEGVFGEPSSTGLGSRLDAFWAAWSDLAVDPSGGASRTLVRDAARQLAVTLNSLDDRITTIGLQATMEVNVAVEEINLLATEIAGLNTKIVELEAGGGSAGDLRDYRDAAIDRIGQFLPIALVEEPSGSVRIMVSEVLLVDRAVSQRIVTRTDLRGRIGLGLAEGTNYFEPVAGRLSGLLTVVNDNIPQVTSQLDQLAASLVGEINAMHQSGTGANGSSGIDFFDATRLTAGTIRVSSDVENSIDFIAAGASGAPGDGGLALRMAGFRSAAIAGLNGLSMPEFHAEIVTALGSEVQNARRVADAQDVLVTSLQGQRDSAHGVSIDEEMVDLITHQQAYAAAARIVSVADEMLQDLLNLV